jgi:hypothetical protein
MSKEQPKSPPPAAESFEAAAKKAVPALQLSGNAGVIRYASPAEYAARTSADVEALRALRPIAESEADGPAPDGSFTVSIRFADR